MARPFTARMADAILARRPLALLAQIDHPLGVRYFWTGIGELEYNGVTWTGLGTLGKIAPIKYSTELAIQELQFEVSGIPLEDSEWLSNDIRNRVAYAWLAAIGIDGQIVRDPKQIVSAELDYPKYQASDDGSVNIQLIARSGFYSLERALDEVHSAEDQRRLYSGDSGCDLIPKLQQQQVIWAPL